MLKYQIVDHFPLKPPWISVFFFLNVSLASFFASEVYSPKGDRVHLPAAGATARLVIGVMDYLWMWGWPWG